MRGVTLPELLTVMVIMGLVASIAIHPMNHALDRAAVDEGAQRYGAMFETARAFAVARARQSRLELDTLRGVVLIELRRGQSTWDTVDQRPLGRAHVGASQTLVTFSSLGVGLGLSNGRIIFSRGNAADTLTISRTGRLKRF
jgi:prepilin-type N-terminal cleavage/methylation domain-containing protein